MTDYALYIAVGKKYAYVPEAASIRVDKGVGRIVGGKHDGKEIKGVTGASTYSSFFAKHKGYEEVSFKSLLEELE